MQRSRPVPPISQLRRGLLRHRSDARHIRTQELQPSADRGARPAQLAREVNPRALHAVPALETEAVAAEDREEAQLRQRRQRDQGTVILAGTVPGAGLQREGSIVEMGSHPGTGCGCLVGHWLVCLGQVKRGFLDNTISTFLGGVSIGRSLAQCR